MINSLCLCRFRLLYRSLALLIVLFAALQAAITAQAQPLLEISTSNGKRIEPVQLEIIDGQVTITDAEGNRATLPLNTIHSLKFDARCTLERIASADRLTSENLQLRAQIARSSETLLLKQDSIQGLLSHYQKRTQEVVDKTPFKPKDLKSAAPPQTATGVSRYSNDGAWGEVVYTTDKGECYHRAGCRDLRKSSYAISMSQARSLGLRACEHCH